MKTFRDRKLNKFTNKLVENFLKLNKRINHCHIHIYVIKRCAGHIELTAVAARARAGRKDYLSWDGP